MDPDAIFIILLYLTMLFLTIGSIIGIFKKIWRANVSVVLKLIVVGLLALLLIFALIKFDGVESGEVHGRQFYISIWQIMIYSASFLIGLNWSINLSNKQSFQKIRVSKSIKVVAMTIMFAILIPTLFYFIGKFFDNLNLLGSGG